MDFPCAESLQGKSSEDFKLMQLLLLTFDVDAEVTQSTLSS